MVILGACKDDDDEALYTPQPMSVNDIAGILKQCRPSTKDLPTDPQASPCVHPHDAQVESYGQLVCTLCGMCTGCVYLRPCYLLPDCGLSIQRKHYRRPEAYLKTYIKRFRPGVSRRIADNLHHMWPYMCKMFRQLAVEDAVIKNVPSPTRIYFLTRTSSSGYYSAEALT